MELHGHFQYCGEDSQNFGIMIAHLDTKMFSNISGEIATVSMFGRRGKRFYFTKDDYSDSAISFDIEFLVDGDDPLDLETQRAVQRWLFYRQGFFPLYLDSFDDLDDENRELVNGTLKGTYINCRFTNPQKLYGNGGVIGYEAQLEADSPLAWQDAVVQTLSFTGGENFSGVASIDIDTDLADYTYPKITITTGSSGGDITIANNSDDPARLTSFTGLDTNSEIIMNEEIGLLSGNSYSKFSNKNFIRLLDGENMISVLGDVVSIRFEWQNRRYL